jgi:hypothetical protein
MSELRNIATNRELFFYLGTVLNGRRKFGAFAQRVPHEKNGCLWNRARIVFSSANHRGLKAAGFLFRWQSLSHRNVTTRLRAQCLRRQGTYSNDLGLQAPYLVESCLSPSCVTPARRH